MLKTGCRTNKQVSGETDLSAFVLKAQNGDTTAFECLYRAFAGRIYGLSLRLLRNPIQAEELTQEIFINAWEKMYLFRGEGSFGSWLVRMTINRALNEIRRQRRYRLRMTVTGELNSERILNENTDLRIDLEEAIAALPNRARAVFVLYEIEGYSHQEIAELLGKSTGTSKAHLHRARKLLKENLIK